MHAYKAKHIHRFSINSIPSYIIIQTYPTSDSILGIHTALKFRSSGIPLALMCQFRVCRKRTRRIPIIHSMLFPRRSRWTAGVFDRLRLYPLASVPTFQTQETKDKRQQEGGNTLSTVEGRWLLASLLRSNLSTAFSGSPFASGLAAGSAWFPSSSSSVFSSWWTFP